MLPTLSHFLDSCYDVDRFKFDSNFYKLDDLVDQFANVDW
jgi:hypothetical protein